MANQFMDENDERLTGVDQVVRPAVRASAAGQPPNVEDPYQGGVVSSIGLQTDTANSQLPGVGNPTYRLMPVATALQPIQGASQQSAAAQAAQSASTPPTLKVPKEFNPTSQTGFLLQIAWAPELEGTVFGVPTIGNAGGSFDQGIPFSGNSSAPISVSLTPSQTNEFAYFFVATIGSGPTSPVPNGNWKLVSSDPPYNGDTTVYTQPGINATLPITAAAPGTAYSGVAALFFATGGTPIPTQPSVVSSTAPNTSVSLNITNAATNANIVTVGFAGSLVKVNIGSIGVTDTNGNKYSLIGSIDDGITGGTSAALFISTNIVGGANTVTVTQSGSASGGSEEVSVTEWVNIGIPSAIPSFIKLDDGMVPAIDLTKVNQNGGVTGILGVGNGGTGLSTPGTSGDVLTSNGTAWVAAPQTGFANPMTTLGDIIEGGASGSPQRLAIGSTGEVLTVVSGVPAWAPASGGTTSFGRKVVTTTTYNQISSDIGKALDVQTSSPTTINLSPAASVPAFVSSLGFNRTSGTTTTGTLSGVTLTLGDCAVISVAWYNTITDAITVADSNGNVWTKVPNTFQQNSTIGGGLGGGQQLWVAVITNGGTGITITATFPVSVQFPAIYGALASGVDPAGPIDQSTSATGNGTPDSGSITTTVPNTIVYGSVYNDSASASGPGAGWTAIQNTFNVYLNEYQVPTTTGTFNATDNSSGTVEFTAAIVSLKGTAASALFSGFVQNNGSSTVTVAAGSGSLINGASSISLAAGTGCTIASDATDFTAIL